MYRKMQYDECLHDDVVVSAYLELSDEAVSDGSFCWDYSLRFENTSNDNIILLGKKLSVIQANGQEISVNYHGFNGQLPQLIPGDDFEDDGYVTSKTNAVLKGSCTIQIGNQVKNIDLPMFSLIANDNSKQLLN